MSLSPPRPISSPRTARRIVSFVSGPNLPPPNEITLLRLRPPSPRDAHIINITSHPLPIREWRKRGHGQRYRLPTAETPAPRTPRVGLGSSDADTCRKNDFHDNLGALANAGASYDSAVGPGRLSHDAASSTMRFLPDAKQMPTTSLGDDGKNHQHVT